MSGLFYTAEIDAPFASPGEWQDLVRRWCPAIAEYAEPAWIETARSSGFVSPLGTEDPEDPLGPPGETYGQYRIARRGYPFGPAVLERRDLRKQAELTLELSRLDEDGWPGREWLSFTARRLGLESGTARLCGNADLGAGPDRADRWVAAWKRMAAELACRYAHISEFDQGREWRTRREARADSRPELAPPTAVARGLGWATVVRLEEISGPRGMEVLSASGCFQEVLVLGGDRCWLQITGRVADYTEDAYQRAAVVFEEVIAQG